jgi:ribonucleoside-diphosphate reductase alpha subunit
MGRDYNKNNNLKVYIQYKTSYYYYFIMSSLSMVDSSNEMYVMKRSGKTESISFDKIMFRLKKLSCMEGMKSIKNIKLTDLVMKIINQLYDNITTKDIDELSAQQCAYMSSIHPDYSLLADRIVISNHHKNTCKDTFESRMEQLYYFKDIHDESCPIISKHIYDIALKYKTLLEAEIDYSRDYLIDYFGFKTLERAYLMRVNKVVIERPQDMWMRVAIGIHGWDIERVIETYHYMSRKYFTHATPTLYNAGTIRPQLSSCYLLGMKEDSIQGIYETLTDCASISKWAGGIGLHIHNVRGKGSHIRGTNGTSNGIVPMLRVFNNTARYVDQGGGKRNGSFAIYLEPWHSDMEDFLELKKNHGDEEMKARDLFYALWVPDLFMKRVEKDQDWTLMCPDKCKGLSDCYGDKFEELYESYEKRGMGIKTIKARKLWFSILDSQIETGTPYLLYKDACNSKSNHKHLGTIKSSNLCTEIIEYSDANETAVCNLASIGLPMFVKNPPLSNTSNVIVYTKDGCPYCLLAKSYLKSFNIPYKEVNVTKDDNDRIKMKEYFKETFDIEVKTLPQIVIDNKYIGGYDKFLDIYRMKFDYEELRKVVKIMTRNLNTVIDVNYYPTNKTLLSNKRHRPIGLGVQGLADVFAKMRYSFTSDEAKDINKKIFETIYYAAIEESICIVKERRNILEKHMDKYRDIEYVNDIQASNDIQNSNTTFWSITKEHKLILNGDMELYRDEFDRLHLIYEECQLYSKYPDSLGTYSSYINSDISKGIFQFDYWNVDAKMYNWNELKNEVKKYGVRNSLFVAPMPTASTSQILGNNECFEPFTSHIYARRTMAGEFMKINMYVLNDLIDLELWNDDMKQEILYNKGSIQKIERIPKIIKDLYKTVWELSMKDLIDMSRDRGAFICQSQSLNLFISDPTYSNLTAMHLYGWKQGLKTGLYYLRTKPKNIAQQFTVDPEFLKKLYSKNTTNNNTNVNTSVNIDEEDECFSCGA